jgi:hypothetical protein
MIITLNIGQLTRLNGPANLRENLTTIHFAEPDTFKFF